MGTRAAGECFPGFFEFSQTFTSVSITLLFFDFASSICVFFLTSDVHQPLSQIRISLASSLGAGQVIFLAGINATGNTVIELINTICCRAFNLAIFRDQIC